MIIQLLAAVLFANGLTLAIFYAAWRIKRNESDLKGIGLMILCCLAVILIALSARQ